MLGFSLGLNGSRKIGGFLPETVALFAKATAEGFDLPSAGCKAAINADIVERKAAGIWTNVDRLFYHANDSGSINFGRINAQDPSRDLATIHGGITNANKEGIKGNGTDGYFDTQFAPSSDTSKYVIADAHALIYIYSSNGGRFLGGSIGSLLFAASNGTAQRLNGGNLSSAVNFGTVGTVGMSRVDGTDIDIMIAGTLSTQVNSATNLPSGDITVLKQGSSYSPSGISITQIGQGLTTTQMAAVNTINAAYMVKMAAL